MNFMAVKTTRLFEEISRQIGEQAHDRINHRQLAQLRPLGLVALRDRFVEVVPRHGLVMSGVYGRSTFVRAGRPCYGCNVSGLLVVCI